MKGLAVIIYLCIVHYVVGQTQQKVTYYGNQLWKITNDHKTTLKLLKNMEKQKYLTIWGLNSTKVDAMIHAEFLEKARTAMKSHNLDYTVAIDDIQKAIEEENPKPEEDLEGRKGYRLTWKYYHNLNDIYEYLHYLEQNFPRLCTVRTIGNSVEARPIKLLKISNGNPSNKAIFIEGGIHSREWISPAAVTYIASQVVSNYVRESNIDWYIVPILNPDGYVYSYNVERLWRKNRSKYKNCVGVDLNRNFGYNWGKNGSSEEPCSNSFRGKRPFSEPETAAVANLFINNPNINWMAYIAVHSYGQYIVYPWGEPNVILEDHEELNKIGTEAAKSVVLAGGESYTVGPAGLAIYPASGISIDWAKGSQAIKYSYTIELRDRGHHGYILPAKYIKFTSEEALIVIKTIANKNIVAAGGGSYTVGPVGKTIYRTSGTSTDWARGGEAVKYSFTIELGDGGQYGFILPAELIRETSEQALILVKTVVDAIVDNSRFMTNNK